MKNATRPLALALLLVTVASCGAKEELEKAQQKVDRLQNQLDQLNQTWKQSNAAIVQAADKIDPFALKQILAENTDLRAMLKKLEDAARAPSTAYLRVQSGTIYLEVESYNGSFKLDAAIEGQDVKFFDGRILGPDEAVFISDVNSLDTGYGDWLTAFCSDHYHNSNLAQCAGNLGGVIDPFAHLLRDRFAKLVADSSQTVANLPKADISSQMNGTGKRTVSVVITPLAPPKAGPWSLRLKVVQQRGKDREVLRLIERSAASYKFVAGTPLESVPIKLELEP